MDPASTPAIYASIDIGSHTIRLLIARYLGDKTLVPLLWERRVTRLAKGFREGGILQESRMNLSTRVLEEYRDCMGRFGVEAVACGATGVVRRAENGGRWLETVRKATGIHGKILSEEEEAFLSAKGILGVLSVSRGHVLAFDLGGSTTEFLLMDARRGRMLWSTSVFIGAATLTEHYFRDDPVSSDSLERAQAAVFQTLSETFQGLASVLSECGVSAEELLLVGTAGTVTTLGAMFLRMERYDPSRLNGLMLEKDWICHTLEQLAGRPIRERRGIPGLEEGREDIILGGTLIVREILSFLGKDALIVSDAGLLEGLLFRLVEERLGWPGGLQTPLRWCLPKGVGHPQPLELDQQIETNHGEAQ